MEAEFAVTPTLRDGFLVLVLEGDLDMVQSPTLEAALDASTDGLPVIVDLTGLSFIDSTGLHTLVQARDRGRPSALVRTPGSNVGRVLDIVQLEKAIPVYGDVAAAVERLRRGPRE